jgi:hypothetical protein
MDTTDLITTQRSAALTHPIATSKIGCDDLTEIVEELLNQRRLLQ